MNFNIELKNGQLLKGFIRTPGENLSGIIAFVHGIGEHTGRYEDWAKRFSMENFAFTGFDLPGHGRSEGKRGSIRRYSILYEMIDIMLKTVSRTYPGLPVWLYGHSLGGGIVLDYAIRFKPAVRGVIATGPWLRLSFEPPGHKLVLANVSRFLVPGFTQSTGLKTQFLSHDKSVVTTYDNDPLVHDRISAAFFAGAMNSAKFSLKNAGELSIPTLIIHGSDDMICSPDGSREFVSKARQAELKIWPGAYHEVHNEPFRDDVFRYLLEWIRKK